MAELVPSHQAAPLILSIFSYLFLWISMRPNPITQDLVLIGGGHSHAIALRKFGMNPVPGVRLTLITDVTDTPYSGMLPGYVAGLYSFDDCHIDLRPLANFAGARLVVDQAIGLDLQNNRVICAHRPAIAFDLLSIDIGSTPTAASVPGAAEYAIPVKPISQFLSRWDALVETLTQQAGDRQNARSGRSLSLGIVGGGTGGVELALAVQSRMQQIGKQSGVFLPDPTLHLFQRGHELMPERRPWVRRKMQRILANRGVQLHLNQAVSDVGEDWVQCESGLKVACDALFWVTQAAAAPWLGKSGLATCDRGFIQVNDWLQSTSHPQVFAAGDVATMVNHPRPKAGVFAVRQGKPLYANLRRALQQQPLRLFVPQKEFLILIGLGDRTAVASRGAIGLGAAAWIWQWKDRVDRAFMDQFAQLKPMEAGMENGAIASSKKSIITSPLTMPCAGCGSKVGSSVLARSLARLRQELGGLERDDILIGLDAPDDAAVITVPAGQVMVQTVDYFRALVNDPFVFGQIAATHALGDLFAMGATPQSALAIATLPYATEAKHEELLYQLLAGAVTVLTQAGAVLIGGHTSEGSDLSFGLACNGLAEPQHLLRKSGMNPGDVLILTKPLGTGTLFAADMQLKAKGRWIEAAIQSMLTSNQTAAALLRTYRATACTDITGFGLVGHLNEMLHASQVAAAIALSALPLLDGARDTLHQGIVSSLHPQNLQAATQIQNLTSITARSVFPILCDPQTCGGLLASIPAETASECLTALRTHGYPHSQAIGRVLPRQADRLSITVVP